MQWNPRVGDERGETLVEMIVAIAIFGIAAAAVLGGLQLSIKVSDIHRKEATGGAYVRSFSEVIQTWVASGHYGKCGAGYMASGDVASFKSGLLSEKASTAALGTVESWNGSSWVNCTTSNDKGVQRLLLSVTSAGTANRMAVESLYLILRKPCNGATPNDPCA